MAPRTAVQATQSLGKEQPERVRGGVRDATVPVCTQCAWSLFLLPIVALLAVHVVLTGIGLLWCVIGQANRYALQ